MSCMVKSYSIWDPEQALLKVVEQQARTLDLCCHRLPTSGLPLDIFLRNTLPSCLRPCYFGSLLFGVELNPN